MSAADPVVQKLEEAKRLMDKGEPDDAWQIVEGILMENPNDPRALMTATHIQEAARRLVVAYQFAERGVKLAPNISQMWENFARVADELYRVDEAERAYLKAIEMAHKPHQKANALASMSAMYVNQGRWKEAEKAAKESLALSDSRKAKCN